MRNRIASLEKELARLEKNPPKMGDDIGAYKRDRAAHEEKKARTRRKKEYWERVESLAITRRNRKRTEEEAREDLARENEALSEMEHEALERIYEEQREIVPVGRGAFGYIYDQFRGKAREAIAFLSEKQGGEAIGALHHKDVGDIDLVWGNEGTGHSDGFGLAKLVKYHPEVLKDLQGLIDDMHVVRRNANRINLESDTHKAAVRLEWDREKKNWLLTAFEKENSVRDNTTDTGTTVTGKQNDTATLQNTVAFGKVTQNSGAEPFVGRSLTEEEAGALIARMEAGAEAAPELELTPENWMAEFGEDGLVETPIGEVKMGENQLAKMFLKKRDKEFGMVKPTLTDPDVILEEASQAKEGQTAERPSSYLFVKTFNRGGKKKKFYASVTVSKEGMEVVISNHYMEKEALEKKMEEDGIIYVKDSVLPIGSDRHLAENPQEGSPDLLPTRGNSESETKGSADSGEKQVPLDDSGNPVYEQAPVEATWEDLLARNEGDEQEALESSLPM